MNLPWQRGQRIATKVSGPGCIIQSDFRTGGHGNFEVVVPLFADDGSMELWHFSHNNSDMDLPWQRGQRIAARVSGPGVLIQSDLRSSEHGNFEVVVPVGNALAHFWHDNSDLMLPWQPGQIITEAVRGGWGTIIQSNIGSGEHGNFEVLTEECKQSLVAYWHPNQDTKLPWIRGGVVLGESYPARITGARKIVQLTGEYDRQGWNGVGTPPFAFNRTESNFGIRGCDLGASFEHDGRLYFLFGDTWRVNQNAAQLNFDSIAFCTDMDPTSGLHLKFLDQPPLLPVIKQDAFNVPLDGVSFDGAMYVFFSTDSYFIDEPLRRPRNVPFMGRSVLGRSDDGGANYSLIGDLSKSRFVNVSVEPGTIDSASAGTGLSVGTPVLWIFGSGRYRSSSIYLAVMPLAGLQTLAPRRYFNGDGWSSSEADAAPLFCAADAGELSVRWNLHLGRWLALYNSGNPRGILMHAAPQPWGPWSSDPVMIFDPTVLADAADPCSGAGYGKFMHVPWDRRRCDFVQDDILPPPQVAILPPQSAPPFPPRNNDWGGEYGPYQIPRFATALPGGGSRIWFVMSTWNPYQVMLMTADIMQAMV
jgi:hypothetical protein